MTEKIGPDALRKIGLELDYLDLLHLCSVSKQVNNICQSVDFWIKKYQVDIGYINYNQFIASFDQGLDRYQDYGKAYITTVLNTRTQYPAWVNEFIGKYKFNPDNKNEDIIMKLEPIDLKDDLNRLIIPRHPLIVIPYEKVLDYSPDKIKVLTYNHHKYYISCTDGSNPTYSAKSNRLACISIGTESPNINKLTKVDTEILLQFRNKKTMVYRMPTGNIYVGVSKDFTGPWIYGNRKNIRYYREINIIVI